MRQYLSRFATGPLSRRVREIALEHDLHQKALHINQHSDLVSECNGAKADALHKAADILVELQGHYDEPYPDSETA